MLLHGGELFLHKFGLMGEGGASSAGALLLAFTRRSAITFSTRPASPLTLPNGGALEHAQEMAAHESPRTTKLNDRTKERLTQDEVERIRL